MAYVPRVFFTGERVGIISGLGWSASVGTIIEKLHGKHAYKVFVPGRGTHVIPIRRLHKFDRIPVSVKKRSSRKDMNQ